MDYAAAQKLAQDEADKFVTNPVVKCPKKKTGLLVLVYRDDAQQEIISGATVSAKGDQTSDGNGIARWQPLTPSKYKVKLASLPADPYRSNLYLKPKLISQKVGKGECPVLDIGVKLLAQPTIKVVNKSDSKAVPGVGVELWATKNHLFPDTDSNGETKWPDSKPGLEPNTDYNVRLTFKGDKADSFLVVDDADQPLEFPKIAKDKLPALCTDTFPFKVKEISWVNFRVVYADGESDVADAKLNIKLADDTRPTPAIETVEEQRVHQLRNFSPGDCTVESIETAEVLEFVEVVAS